jgi:hypothetical protein
MDNAQHEAWQSLAAIENSTKQMKRSISSRYTAPLLILWGIIWILAFLGCHFWSVKSGQIWLVLDVIGFACTSLIIFFQLKTAGPIKYKSPNKIAWRVFRFWGLIFGYVWLWLSIFAPYSGLQMNAFICTAIMFGFILIGMWSQEYYLVWLALLVTAATAAGVFLLPHKWYCLWMTATAGAPMFLTGIYLKLFRENDA